MDSVAVQSESVQTEKVDVKDEGSPRVSGTVGPLQECRPVFHWSNVDYEIIIQKETRQILRSVEGWVRPGSLTALIVRTSTPVPPHEIINCR